MITINIAHLNSGESFNLMGISSSNIILFPSPRLRLTALNAETNFKRECVSIEAAWSLPYIARSLVICFSMEEAPKATAAAHNL